MSLRPSLIHSCHDQSVGNPRPDKCKCRYRVSLEQAKKLVEEGLASWLIVDYKKDSEGKSIPVTSWNLVWGAPQSQDPEGTVRSALAMKTPRVQTIEKAHIERSFCHGDSKGEKARAQEERDRIEAYGDLARQVIADMTIETPVGFVDHFKGRAILTLIGLDQRTSPGKDVTQDTK